MNKEDRIKQLTRELIDLLQSDDKKAIKFTVEIEGYDIRNTISPGSACDNNRRTNYCLNDAKYCVSRWTIDIDADKDHDHYHICESCAKECIKSQKEFELL